MKFKELKRKIRDYLLRKGYTLKYFEPRPSIKLVHEYFGNNRIRIKGLEIGVWYGDHAQEIKTYLNCDLYLIDPYEEYDEGRGAGHGFQKELGIAKEVAHKRLKDVIWTDRNLTETLDFVYIDGNHSYEAVKTDIEFAEKLVKHGVIGGHDYSWDYPGVVDAVNEKFNNFQFKSNDWWVII